MDVAAAIKEFLFHCEFEKHLSDKTLKAYGLDLKQFQGFLAIEHQGLTIKAVDKTILKAFIKWIYNDKKSKTVKRKIATLKAMFNFLEFEDYLAVNPFRKMRVTIKEPSQLPSVMTIQEVKKILTCAYRQKEQIQDRSLYAYFATTRDIAVLELLFATGIRVSELCHLDLGAIDPRNGLVKVYGKGKKERIIQVCNQETLAVLREYRKLSALYTGGEDCFFVNRYGRRLSEQSVRFMIKRYASLANIDKPITPHTFRHTFATMLLEEDVDIKYIQHLLGHSSIMTTQIYTHVNKKKQHRILSKRHPRRYFRMVD